MSEVFSFDVTVSTHGLLRAGVCEARMLNGANHHRIVVAADTYSEAFLTAAQMAGCTDVRHLHGRPLRGSSSVDEGGVMCTGVYVRI
jgi:hypothetical protein